MNIIILKKLIVFLLRQNTQFYSRFYSDLNKFNNLNPKKESTKEKKVTLYDNASELFNEYLEIYFNEYKALSDAQKKELGNKYDLNNLFLEIYNYDVWLESEE